MKKLSSASSGADQEVKELLNHDFAFTSSNPALAQSSSVNA